MGKFLASIIIAFIVAEVIAVARFTVDVDEQKGY